MRTGLQKTESRYYFYINNILYKVVCCNPKLAFILRSTEFFTGEIIITETKYKSDASVIRRFVVNIIYTRTATTHCSLSFARTIIIF